MEPDTKKYPNKTTASSVADSLDHAIAQFGVLSIIILIMGVGGYVLQDYLFFKKLFVFDGFASDTIRQFFPEYYFRAERLYKLNFTFWSFQLGLGTNIYSMTVNFNPFDYLLLLFGKERFVYAIPYVFLLKCAVAGGFFFAFLRRLDIDTPVAMIGALCFGFSGYMIVNGHWYHYQNYAVLFAMTLFLFELWFQKGKWLPLVLLFGLLSLKGILQIYQFSLFFMWYGICRVIMERGFAIRQIITFVGKFAVLFTIAIGLCAYTILPESYQLLSSTRGGSSVQGFAFWENATRFIKTADLPTLGTLYFRSFSSDLLGSFERYKGLSNYLEGPVSYVGLLMLITAPVAFLKGSRRYRTGLAFLLSACVIYILFPYSRYAGNAFASGTFKHTVMYFGTVIILFGSIGLNEVFRREKQSLNLILIYIAILITPLIYTAYKQTWYMDHAIFERVVFLLGVYCAVLLLIINSSFKNHLKYILLAVVVIEIAMFAKMTVDRSSGALRHDFVKRGDSYFDPDTQQALAFIKSGDDRFYRIAKDYISEHLNDAWVQGYFGTTAYYGFSASEVVDFYKILNLSKRSPRLSSYRFGLEKRYRLKTLLGVKYLLARDPANAPPGYLQIAKFGDVHVYKNQNFLPIGFAYTEYIPKAKFKRLPNITKDRMLLKAFVAEKNDYGIALSALNPKTQKASDVEFVTDVSSRKQMAFHLREFNEDNIKGEVDLKSDALLFFSIPFNRGWQAYVDGEKSDLVKVNIGFIGLPLQAGSHTIELKFRPYLAVTGVVISLFSIFAACILYFFSPYIPALKPLKRQRS